MMQGESAPVNDVAYCTRAKKSPAKRIRVRDLVLSECLATCPSIERS